MPDENTIFARACNELTNEERPEIYRESLAHLVSGKNVVFQGPPGTGKTRAARLLSRWVCGDDYFKIITAHAELTRYDLVGGYAPDSDGGFTTQPGPLAEIAHMCQQGLRSNGRPAWLIIDELNRANLDQSFGEVFTLLDPDYRDTKRLEYGDNSAYLPKSFRIISTMNTYDRAQLFELGYAFRRRFAIVDVGTLLADETSISSDEDDIDLPSVPDYVALRDGIIEDSVIESLSHVEMLFNGTPLSAEEQTEQSPFGRDAYPIEPSYADASLVREQLTSISNGFDHYPDERDFIDVLIEFCFIAAHNNLIEIGQAMVIDAVKFVVAYSLLFPDELDHRTVEQAVISYILPQFDIVMPELRQAETIGTDNEVIENFDQTVRAANALRLDAVASQLREMQAKRGVT
jgi:DNA polymerase III delta prime subunit